MFKNYLYDENSFDWSIKTEIKKSKFFPGKHLQVPLRAKIAPTKMNSHDC